MSSFKRRIDSHVPLVYAHRGANTCAPENTLAAFCKARQQGADGIEMDVKLTADGEVVIMHDQTVNRTTNGHGLLRSFGLVDLRRLDAGSWFDNAFRGERVPTLGEIFETLQDSILYDIELTNYGTPFDQLLDKVLALIQKYELAHKVMVTSFFPNNISRFRSLAPSIEGGVIALKGMAGFLSRSIVGRWFAPRAVIPVYLDLTPKYMLQQKAQNRKVFPWTVNDPADIQRMARWGVDGLITDVPETACKTLEAL
ncbi:MAG TPA: glycerophosphodiester phosphodiesterase family protein [Anaerolineaceae bacterium]